MSRPRPLTDARVAAPALLLAGVGVAVLLFALGQRGPSAPAAELRPPSDAASAAHAAAGIVIPAGGAAQAFDERVHALRAQVAAEPGRRERVLQLARLLHDGHRTADAVPYYRKAIELDPRDAQAYYDLASAHAELAQWDEAADVLQDRLDQDPLDGVARYDLAAVRANEGRTGEAARLFEEARAATTDGALLARISDALARLKGR
jgi:tetratricopeptide (TPR) repeat protein